LKDRLDVFKRHVALYKRQAGNIRQEEIQLELILQ
jgi:hypothetical protein